MALRGISSHSGISKTHQDRLKEALSNRSSKVSNASTTSSSSSSSSSSRPSSSSSSTSSKSQYVNTGGVGNSGGGVKQTTSTPTYSTSPTYGQDSQGYYKSYNGNKTYVTEQNKQYFPSNYGGTANWKYNSNNISTPTTNVNKQSGYKQNGYTQNYLNNYYGTLANDLSYEGIKKQQETLNSMKGADESLYANDEYAHRMWQVANGMVDFGSNVNPYAQTQYASTDKRYENDLSQAELTARHLFSMVGNEGINQYLNMSDAELASAMNGMGLKAITNSELRNTVLPKNGVTKLAPNYSDFLRDVTTTNINGQTMLNHAILDNYSLKPNGEISLNNGLVNVNGTPVHWTNYVKYGDSVEGMEQLYSNMIQNEKRTGQQEKVPLKFRAKYAPETMTEEMTNDLMMQNELESQIFNLDRQINAISELSKRPVKPIKWTASVSSNNSSNTSSDNSNNTADVGGSNAYGYSGSYTPSVGMSGGYSPAMTDEQMYLQAIGRGKRSEYGTGLGNLSAQQLMQLNAMRDKMLKQTGRK